MLGRAIATIAHAAADLAFPARCVHCRTEGQFLCGRCVRASVRLDGPACDRCALPVRSGSRCERCFRKPPALDRLVAAYQFDGAMRDAIHALKYDGLRAVAPTLGSLLAGLPRLKALKYDVIVPVPAQPARLKARGYNHAELIAREAAKILGAQVETQPLRRIGNGHAQVGARSLEERARQVEGAFAAAPADVVGRRVLVIDDVATTCSTLNACAKALKAAGATWAGAAVVAREL